MQICKRRQQSIPDRQEMPQGLERVKMGGMERHGKIGKYGAGKSCEKSI